MEENREGLFGGEETTVTITLEDDSTIDCVVLTIFEADDREYIAVMPEDENNENIYLYRYRELEEYEIVSDAFDELLDEQEFNEIMGDFDDEE